MDERTLGLHLPFTVPDARDPRGAPRGCLSPRFDRRISPVMAQPMTKPSGTPVRQTRYVWLLKCRKVAMPTHLWRDSRMSNFLIFNLQCIVRRNCHNEIFHFD